MHPFFRLSGFVLVGTGPFFLPQILGSSSFFLLSSTLFVSTGAVHLWVSCTNASDLDALEFVRLVALPVIALTLE